MEGGGFILLSIGPSIPAPVVADPIELPAPPPLLRLAV